MSKEYEESSGSTIELAVAREAVPYESSSLLSWKVMFHILIGKGGNTSKEAVVVLLDS